MHRPHLLFLDAYDSFSNNIISLLHCDLNATVEVIKIDDKRFVNTSDACFHAFLQTFDAVVAGPGPGDPRNPHHLGLIGKLWDLPDHVCLPVLGICLGFQSLALAYGATAGRLQDPRHGLVTEVAHTGTSLFQSIGLLHATQYHSLHVRLSQEATSASSADLWSSTADCPLLEPLAWDLTDDIRNGPILMGLRHVSKPFFGVQYHPESICTSFAGAQIIHNWWNEALAWIIGQAAARLADVTSHPTIDVDSCSASSDSGNDVTSRDSSVFDADHAPLRDVMTTAATTPAITRQPSRNGWSDSLRSVSWKCIDLPSDGVNIALLLQEFQNVDENAIMLESGTKNGEPVRPETGRYSIIACTGDAQSIRYSTGNRLITTDLSGAGSQFKGTISDVWSSVESFMAANRATNGPADVPFWGGLVGYVSYEAGLETIDVPQPANNDRPDVWFVFVSRSIVVDHVEQKVYLQTLEDADDEWMKQTEETVIAVYDNGPRQMAADQNYGHEEKTTNPLPKKPGMPNATSLSSPSIKAPVEDEYVRKVQTCQEHIRAGSSYELCLTDKTIIEYAEEYQPSSFELYQRLRTSNPAPFGAYLRLKGNEEEKRDAVTILSSSPERFLSWSRAGKCQFRPIKGTVEKKEGITREKAEKLLNCDKERAENLMIVDLIRHDLHGVVGSGNVTVEKLMTVEEYQTVFQLVSVIEGQLPEEGRKTGIDVLAASLPPGSMTGAPKKRSCELLTEIEGLPRGIYSGVLGYFDVGGGGDFSVVIRTAFQWDDEGVWRIGAGGAVTVLSSPLAEFQEMDLKRQSCLPAFGLRRGPG